MKRARCRRPDLQALSAELGTRVRDWRLVSDSSICFCDATYLRLALKDLRLDLRLEHKDLRLTRDSTLKTRDILATCKSLCYSRVVIKDELGKRQKILTRFLLHHIAPLLYSLWCLMGFGWPLQYCNTLNTELAR